MEGKGVKTIKIQLVSGPLRCGQELFNKQTVFAPILFEVTRQANFAQQLALFFVKTHQDDFFAHFDLHFACGVY